MKIAIKNEKFFFAQQHTVIDKSNVMLAKKKNSKRRGQLIIT